MYKRGYKTQFLNDWIAEAPIGCDIVIVNFFVNSCRPSPTFHKFNLSIKVQSKISWESSRLHPCIVKSHVLHDHTFSVFIKFCHISEIWSSSAFGSGQSLSWIHQDQLISLFKSLFAVVFILGMTWTSVLRICCDTKRKCVLMKW